MPEQGTRSQPTQPPPKTTNPPTSPPRDAQARALPLPQARPFCRQWLLAGHRGGRSRAAPGQAARGIQDSGCPSRRTLALLVGIDRKINNSNNNNRTNNNSNRSPAPQGAEHCLREAMPEGSQFADRNRVCERPSSTRNHKGRHPMRSQSHHQTQPLAGSLKGRGSSMRDMWPVDARKHT